MEKVKKKKWSNNYIQTTCTSSYHEKKYAKFQINRYKTVRGVALIRGTHCLYIGGKKWLSSQCGKVTKNVLTILPKPHAHPYTVKKTHAKFQNNQYKTVRGVVLTGGTHCLYTEVKNDKVNNVEKVTKNNLTITFEAHAHLHTMTKTHAKFQKDRYKTIRGVALTRHPV